MLVSGFARQACDYLVQGPADLPRSLKLEWRFVSARWLCIALLTPCLALASLPPGRLLAAYAVLVVAAIYTLSLRVAIPRFPSSFLGGFIPTAGDSVLVFALVVAGGGFTSPFYLLLFTLTLSAALRYGYGPSLAIVLLFALFDLLESWSTTRLIVGHLLFRSAFLCLTAVLVSYLRQKSQQAEAALQERLRLASLLNEATSTLAASLELERALQVVVAAASRLFGSDCAVLVPAAGLDDGATTLENAVLRPASESTAVYDELATLCRGRLSNETRAPNSGGLVHYETLASGRKAMVLKLAQPTHQKPMATLALAAPDGWPAPVLDRDIVASFVERTAQAIENASLYRSFERRSKELQRAYGDLIGAHQELLSVDEMKTNFLANVSHELRTPLSSIRSFSELLLTYDDDAVVRQEFLQIINSESERLTRLVNDVLDITKIESGKMDWHESTFDLAPLLRETARTFSGLMGERQLDFELDLCGDLLAVHADRDRLQQVVSNLLNNAIKFTPRGTIRLSAGRDGQRVYVCVSDTGIGIAPDDHERIFDKFQQVGATLTDKPKGTGLGLAICREIIEHHGGRLWVVSQVGAGSSFAFRLPAAEAACQHAERVMDAA